MHTTSDDGVLTLVQRLTKLIVEVVVEMIHGRDMSTVERRTTSS